MNLTRNLKTLGCLACLLLAAAAGGMNAWEAGRVAPEFHASYKTAASAAALDQSLVLLVFSAEWCGPCKLLKQQTLAAPAFLAQDNPLHIADVDIDADQKMARDFHVEAVPTLVLLTPDGKIIARQTGFMNVPDLLAWLQSGRTKAAAGQWEGTAPGAQFDALIKQAAAGDLGTNEIRRLVDLLGDPDPANREAAVKLLLAQRENAVPPLIAAVGNPYLGERIAAGEALQRLAPDLTPVDPWQSPLEMSNTVAGLRRWWAAAGQLPPPAAAVSSPNEVKAALEQLRGDDPVRRTAAMTTLVNMGSGSLPFLRDAIKRAERTGDQRTLGLLEDIRWTVLVPDAIEQSSGGLRQVLARGKSLERQAAAERLAGFGRDALGLLTELAGDADPVVVEGAIHALSSLKGSDAVSALAGLLNSPDSNVRMTAAQSLGHLKQTTALKPLVAATSDSDEVVACAALAALEESLESESYNRSREVPAEVSAGLKQALADSRWRVRATAAEVAGKLADKSLVVDLKKRLDDPDGFVVKNALTALGQLSATPETSQIVALAQRLPSLQGDAVALLLQSENDETVKAVTGLFNAGNNDTRVAILGAFLGRFFSGYAEADEGWKPMMTQAIASPDLRVRHTAAQVLERRTPALAAQLVGPLLADEDAEIRQLAAGKLLEILARGTNDSSHNHRFISGVSASKTETNQPFGTPAQLAAWHQALLQHWGSQPGLNQAAALFATGDGQSDLPMLLAALANTNQESSLHADAEAAAFQALLPKLSLPGGRPVLDKLITSPQRYAQAMVQSRHCQPEITDYLLDSVRFKSVMEPAAGTVLSGVLEIVTSHEYEEKRGWSLWNETDRTRDITLALLNSTNAAWRAAAIFFLGQRADAGTRLPLFDQALTDPDPWVRHAAVQAVGRNVKSRPALESRLGGMLADTNPAVAAIAAIALLEPETRAAASLESVLDYFEYESIRSGRSESSGENDERPVSALEGRPAFLAAARNWLAATNGPAADPFLLLLAQYGDFSGVDRLAKAPAQASQLEGEELYPILAAIALSRDSQYVPLLKQMLASKSQEWELRRFLQAMKGMSGPEARQLRLDINKKIRQNGSSGSQD